MKTDRTLGRIGRIECILLIFMISFVLTGSASAEIISSARRVTWQGNVGVYGDIPNRTTICTTLDPGANIQTAIDNCPSGQVVKLNAGTFEVSSPIRIKSGVTLRGAGSKATIIKAVANISYVVGFDNTPDWSYSGSKAIDIINGNTKGSSVISTSTPHGWSVGEIILIDQLHDPTGDPKIAENIGAGCTYCGRENGTRPIGQLAKVVDVPTTTSVTLEIPLYWNYDLTKTPQAIKEIGLVKNAGIENLKVDASTVTLNLNYGTIMSFFSDNCWVYNVEVYGVEKAGIYLYNAYRNTIRGNRIHKTKIYTSNHGYGMWIFASSANLIEDNIFHDLTVGVTFNSTTSGNVISYNYMTDMQSTDYPNAIRPGIPAHGAHAMMNLFEGNYLDGPNISADYYHGTSSHLTFLRNIVKLDQSKTVGISDLELWYGNTYYNFVGNVLGTVGWETTYQNNNPYSGKNVYCLDYVYDSTPADGRTAASMLRHGNWDSVNNSFVWDAGIADHNIPNSYYLASKPSFFGACAWPPVGPDLTPMVRTLPAKDRYEGGGICYKIPSSPQNLRLVP
jgi:parallel beta-helix repeat protein